VVCTPPPVFAGDQLEVFGSLRWGRVGIEQLRRYQLELLEYVVELLEAAAKREEPLICTHEASER
jgi:hypothetical protein